MKDFLIKKAMQEIEKLIKDLEEDGKDLRLLKLKKFQKTHHLDCRCVKCKKAIAKDDPRLRGLREVGFKVYVEELDPEG